MDIYSDIGTLKGVGLKVKEQLNNLGIFSVYDLLNYFPRVYEDWRSIYTIKSAPLNQNVCIRAYVGSVVREHYVRKGMTTYRLDATDGESVMELVYFNNKYAPKALENGKEYLFFGKLTSFGGHYKSMNSPRAVPVDENSTDMRPVYGQSGILTTNRLEKLIKNAFENVTDIVDCIPEKIRNDYCLMGYRKALYNIHFPENADMLSEAKRRIGFEEMLILQLGLSRIKIKNRKSTSVIIENNYAEEFYDLIPFKLTGAQKRAINDCIFDMSRGIPMNRLLQGDVGSGKTAVAAAIIYNCIRNGYQATLMAPTEVLAQQHYKTFCRFFENTDIKVGILTGSLTPKNKTIVKQSLAAGEINLLIGTHALIQNDVVFQNLGLSITDEQHRFGVEQRGKLSEKGKNPHTLVMSATPIPRTLSLIIYGDLDISILDEMPVGRQKTETYLIDSEKKERAYGYVKKHILEGHQGYIICPLIEDDENAENVTSASVQVYKELRDGYFKGFNVGLLHGKMKSAEKNEVMSDFASGKIDLLVSTTVVEVGVDVPNAVIMIIENAEQFGLSQLHQLRGRIGRGDVKSTCILISAKTENQNAERLKILTSTTDGFKIADEDLRLRGPGDFLGSRQHGLPALKSAGLINSPEIIRETHILVEKMLAIDPMLSGEEYDELKRRVNKMFSKKVVLN